MFARSCRIFYASLCGTAKTDLMTQRLEKNIGSWALVVAIAILAACSSGSDSATSVTAAAAEESTPSDTIATTVPLVPEPTVVSDVAAVPTADPESTMTPTGEPTVANSDESADPTPAVADVTSTFVADVWADNWFALYVDGELVGEDSVPITTERSFNKETLTFEATYPFTVAIEAKDFKETDSGIEYIGLNNQQMGDGGIIAQITDSATGQVVAVTSSDWKTFVAHRAPLNPECEQDVDPDATCEYEINTVDSAWAAPTYDDAGWNTATEWSETAVSPKDGYNQVTWDPSAKLIWGTDLEVDNTVLLRTTVGSDGTQQIAATADQAIAPTTACLTAIDGAIVTCGVTEIVIESDGLPSHVLMEGIANGAWNGQWPAEQDYTGSNAFVIPTQVILADEPALTVMNATGVTANGVPFFFPHAPGRAGDADCLDLPAEILPEGECMRDPVLAGEMDVCGGHTGRGNDYHYHGTPTCMIDELPAGAIVGYMLDGIAMYVEPLEGSVPYQGCSGWISPDGLLHYAFQDSFPYLTSCMLGEFSEGPRTQGSEVFTGGLDARTIGSISSYTSEAGCQTMTFSTGAQLTHCA